MESLATQDDIAGLRQSIDNVKASISNIKTSIDNIKDSIQISLTQPHAPAQNIQMLQREP